MKKFKSLFILIIVYQLDCIAQPAVNFENHLARKDSLTYLIYNENVICKLPESIGFQNKISSKDELTRCKGIPIEDKYTLLRLKHNIVINDWKKLYSGFRNIKMPVRSIYKQYINMPGRLNENYYIIGRKLLKNGITSIIISTKSDSTSECNQKIFLLNFNQKYILISTIQIGEYSSFISGMAKSTVSSSTVFDADKNEFKVEYLYKSFVASSPFEYSSIPGKDSNSSVRFTITENGSIQIIENASGRL